MSTTTSMMTTTPQVYVRLCPMTHLEKFRRSTSIVSSHEQLEEDTAATSADAAAGGARNSSKDGPPVIVVTVDDVHHQGPGQSPHEFPVDGIVWDDDPVGDWDKDDLAAAIAAAAAAPPTSVVPPPSPWEELYHVAIHATSTTTPSTPTPSLSSFTLVSYGATATGKHAFTLGTTKTTMNPDLAPSLPASSSPSFSLAMHILHEIFNRRIPELPTSTECTIRFSFVELYLERWIDLLWNSTGEGDQVWIDSQDEYSPIHGASELCCVTMEDCIQAMNKGLASTCGRSEDDKNPVSSHLVWQLRLTQVDTHTDTVTTTVWRIIELSGSESIRTPVQQKQQQQQRQQEQPPQEEEEQNSKSKKRNSSPTPTNTEAQIMSASLQSLHYYLMARIAEQDGRTLQWSSHQYAHVSQMSKLFHSLLPPHHPQQSQHHQRRFVCFVSASPASYSIKDTLETFTLASRLRQIQLSSATTSSTTTTRPPILALSTYPKHLYHAQRQIHNLKQLCHVLALECHSIHQQLSKNDSSTPQSRDGIWDLIRTIVKSKEDHPSAMTMTTNPDLIAQLLQTTTTTTTANDDTRSAPPLTTTTSGESDELSVLRAQLDEARRAQERAERNAMAYRSEYITLQGQHQRLITSHDSLQEQWQTSQEQAQTLSKSQTTLESQLLTSQFREREAIVILRQFRCFYMRLLKSKVPNDSVNVSGRVDENTTMTMIVNDGIQDLPGVGDLKDLLAIDQLMIQSGLMESSEAAREDIPRSHHSYTPSEQALHRSHTEAIKCENTERDSNRRVDDDGSSTLVQRDEDAVVHRQRLVSSPAGTLIVQNELEMEDQIIELSRKYGNLQLALQAEKDMVDVLSSRQGALGKMKAVTEVNTIKTQLQRRSMELQTALWKMSELHTVIKTMNDKVEHRDQQLLFLEEMVQNLNGQTEQMSMELQNEYRRHQVEHSKLKQKMEHGSIPLWQRGETKPPAHGRLVIPVTGGATQSINNNVNDNNNSKKAKKKAKKKKISLEDIAKGGLYLLLEPPVERKANRTSSTQTDLPVLPETAVVETQTDQAETVESGIQTDTISQLVDSETQTEPEVTVVDMNRKATGTAESSTSMHTSDTALTHDISTMTEEVGVQIEEEELYNVDPTDHGRLPQSDPSPDEDHADEDSSWNGSGSWRKESLNSANSGSSVGSGPSSRSISVNDAEGEDISQSEIRRLPAASSWSKPISPYSIPKNRLGGSMTSLQWEDEDISQRESRPLPVASSRSKLDPFISPSTMPTNRRRGSMAVSHTEDDDNSQRESRRRPVASSRSKLDSLISPVPMPKNRLGGSMAGLNTITSTTGTPLLAAPLTSPRRNKSTCDKPEWMQKLVAKQKPKEPEKPEWMKKLKQASAETAKPNALPWAKDQLSKKSSRLEGNSPPTSRNNSNASKPEPEWVQKVRASMSDASTEEDREGRGGVPTDQSSRAEDKQQSQRLSEWKERFEQIGLKNQIEIMSVMDHEDDEKQIKQPTQAAPSALPEWKQKFQDIVARKSEL